MAESRPGPKCFSSGVDEPAFVMPRFRRPELLVLGVTFALGVALLWLAPRPGGTGLVGRYWDNSDWAGEPVVEALGAVPTAADVLGRFRGASVASSAEWSGYLVAEHAGTHRFVTESDDGSWLFVGERLVVDNGGQHENRVSEGTVDLEAGLHPIRIRYFQAGGDLSLGVYWIPPDGSQRRLMAEALVPSSAAAESAFGGWRWSTLVLAAPVLWSAVFVYLLARVGFSLVWRQVEQTAPERRDRRVVALVMAGGTLLAVWGIGWGLVGNSWAADELPAGFVRDLIANRLAGGWHDKYSQMHFMVLAVPVSTFVLAEHLWAAAADTVASQAAQLALMRLVSTVMAVGVIGAAYVGGAELGGPRQGVLSALALVLTPLFAYYGKLANLDIPALCWFGWAIVAFIRIVRRQRLGDYVLLGVMAAAAVATKDQAYANVALLIPAVIVVTARARPEAGWLSRWGGALVDRRVLAAGAAAAAASVLFHNLLFNLSGFIAHMRLLSTLGDLAIVPRTVAGYLELTALGGELFAFAFGWPLTGLVVIGLAGAVLRPDRRWWLWLLVVPLSFQLTFTFVTLYTNDRYQLGGVFVLALFAGAAAADLLKTRRWHLGAVGLVAAVLLYSALRAVSMDVMMVRDSRYEVRRWLLSHAPEGARVGMVGNYLPYLPYPYESFMMRAATADVRNARPDYIVVNERFAARYAAERSPDGRELMRGLEDGTLGYEEVFRYRSAMPAWAVLAGEAEFRRQDESTLTNLDKVNPEMSVYRRRP